jgi:type II secretory pathway pseudopilin PulG
MGRSKRAEWGLTLVEILISISIFAIGMIAVAGIYASVGGLGESGYSLTQAMNDARVVLEEMRRTADAYGLNNVTVTYPEGQNLAVKLGLKKTLPDETITVVDYTVVDYWNSKPALLWLKLSVQWSERNRNRSTSIYTSLTRR